MHVHTYTYAITNNEHAELETLVSHQKFFMQTKQFGQKYRKKITNTNTVLSKDAQLVSLVGMLTY